MKANTNMNIKVGYKEKIIYINVYIHIPKYTNKAQIYGQRNCCTHFMKCPSRQGAGREGMGHGARELLLWQLNLWPQWICLRPAKTQTPSGSPTRARLLSFTSSLYLA